MKWAKKAVDGFLTAAQKTATTLETQANAAQTGVKDVREKVMSFAEENINNSFEFAQKLVRAKDIQEVMQHHSDYLKAQAAALQAQIQDFGQVVQSSMQKAATEAQATMQKAAADTQEAIQGVQKAASEATQRK